MPMPSDAKQLFDEMVPAALAKHPERAKEVNAIYCFKISGDGGGEWTIAMDGSDAPTSAPADVTLTADVVDWCRLAGERLAPEDLRYSVEGDKQLADDLVAAAPAFATL